MRIQAEIVHGKCPTCEEHTMLVGLTKEFYRCTNCGCDTRQHVNGSIRYLKLSESDKAYIRDNGQT